ncbi:MAG: DUF5985 family protein [Candidatus Manganitrophus sp.]|nr:DUF5985 family protein [Candidatus Manganitrophus sp.]MDC4223015.1 DUF5985 family protein [Candidatus Manganitrophus sp.]WDT71371.1 MAG: DUF5985 family protein [Candidatus Manganitrophus sp.]WDT76372.1 MAG: DUF5985 family protein [Candidatus Manganitrophus sp.]WDT81303.1 MAG: DUF5985 family protein [Candidatus Manganitrophus sp.]
MAATVYFLSAITSLGCALMLFRGYLRSQTRLLLWSSLCFVGLTLNNFLLYIDLVIVPDSADLSILRSIAALAGLMLLIYGLIWDVA